jgi:Co/Zn/Cd efflux system component
LARRPANADRTYGNRRYQTLAAYTNGLKPLALTAWVVVEAARRLIAPTRPGKRLNESASMSAIDTFGCTLSAGVGFLLET